MWPFTTGYLARVLPCNHPTPSPRKSAIRARRSTICLVFHIVFGKTVPDISLNAVANLGYADCRFLKPVYPGATLTAVSEVIGLRENSNKKTGIVYVRSRGFDETGDTVLDYARWVMVRKRDEAAPAPAEKVPELPKIVEPAQLGGACPIINPAAYDTALAGSPHRFGDYKAGEKIDHLDGVTVEEAEHQIATRLYQNTARIHFNQFAESKGRFGRRLIYGGHAISLARALSFNGLGNAFHVAAINGGRHVGAAVCRLHGLCMVGGARHRRAARARMMSARCDCARLRPKIGLVRDFPVKSGRRLRSGGDPRSRLLGANAAVRHQTPRSQMIDQLPRVRRQCFDIAHANGELAQRPGDRSGSRR